MLLKKILLGVRNCLEEVELVYSEIPGGPAGLRKCFGNYLGVVLKLSALESRFSDGQSSP